MKRIGMKTAGVFLALCLCILLLSGCAREQKPESGEHQPLTIMTAGLNFSSFEALLREKYPEVRLEFVSYTGGNGTGYAQYLLNNGRIPDIFTISIFGSPDRQKASLLDLSGFEFLNNYKTADINQVTLDGAVYLVPTSASVICLYYNQTMFAEHGWELPDTFEDLKTLTRTIRDAGIDPVSAQFELPGNGFFDLFTLAKTDFLSTPDGLKWEQDFKDGKATAREGLSDAAAQFQELIDCGFVDAEDTLRTMSQCRDRFFNRESAMYLNAGSLTRFTQNKDGTGDRYGVMPFLGRGEDNSVLISKPLTYFGLSAALGKPENAQKLEDALKVMELLATAEGQQSLFGLNTSYIAPLKNTEIPPDSPFYEVAEELRTGHISTLAYAGYEPIIIGVGEKVRDWVAGTCTGDDVLDLADRLQADSLNDSIPPIAVASQDFTLEETAQLQAEAIRLAAGADIGLLSLGGWHAGVENLTGVCGMLLKGDITQMEVNAIPPALFGEPICLLTLSGGEIRSLLETGFVPDPEVEGFPYVPAGITVTKTTEGAVEKITWADGSAFDESASYTVAIDKDGYTEESGAMGDVRETELLVVDVVGDYLSANSPVSPLPHSIR